MALGYPPQPVFARVDITVLLEPTAQARLLPPIFVLWATTVQAALRRLFLVVMVPTKPTPGNRIVYLVRKAINASPIPIPLYFRFCARKVMSALQVLDQAFLYAHRAPLVTRQDSGHKVNVWNAPPPTGV